MKPRYGRFKHSLVLLVRKFRGTPRDTSVSPLVNYISLIMNKNARGEERYRESTEKKSSSSEYNRYRLSPVKPWTVRPRERLIDVKGVSTNPPPELTPAISSRSLVTQLSISPARPRLREAQ